MARIQLWHRPGSVPLALHHLLLIQLTLWREELSVGSTSVLDHVPVSVTTIPLPGAGPGSRWRVRAVDGGDADRPLQGNLPGSVRVASYVPLLGVAVVLEVGVVRLAAVARGVEELDGDPVVVGHYVRLGGSVWGIDAGHPLARVQGVEGGPGLVPVALHRPHVVQLLCLRILEHPSEATLIAKADPVGPLTPFLIREFFLV